MSLGPTGETAAGRMTAQIRTGIVPMLYGREIDTTKRRTNAVGRFGERSQGSSLYSAGVFLFCNYCLWNTRNCLATVEIRPRMHHGCRSSICPGDTGRDKGSRCVCSEFLKTNAADAILHCLCIGCLKPPTLSDSKKMHTSNLAFVTLGAANMYMIWK